MLGRAPELPALAVADHIERLRAEDRNAKQNAQILRLAQEDVAAEAGEFLNLTLEGLPLGGNDFDCGIEALDLVETDFNLLEEFVQRRVPHHLARTRLGAVTDGGN